MKRKACLFHFFPSPSLCVFVDIVLWLEFIKISCRAKYSRWRIQPIYSRVEPDTFRLCRAYSTPALHFTYTFFYCFRFQSIFSSVCYFIAWKYDVNIVFIFICIQRSAFFWNSPKKNTPILIFIKYIFSFSLCVCLLCFVRWIIFALHSSVHVSSTYFFVGLQTN